MDHVSKYQQIIIQFLEELANRNYSNAPGIERQVVTDNIHHHYQLLNIGWHRGRFVFSPLLHFDIRNGKVWVQQNGTELEIGDELIARGIDVKDIVLGFIPEEERGLVKFVTVS